MEEEQFALRSRPAFITLGAHACWKLAATQGHIIHAEAMFSGGLLPADLHSTVGPLQDAYLCPEIWVSLIQTYPQDILMLKAQGSQILPPAGGPQPRGGTQTPQHLLPVLGKSTYDLESGTLLPCKGIWGHIPP